MSVYIHGVEIPTDNTVLLRIYPESDGVFYVEQLDIDDDILDKYWAVPVPEHGDLIDRDALIKDGWLNLHKEVMRMGGYAIHELPLKNPSIPVIIPADKEGEG